MMWAVAVYDLKLTTEQFFDLTLAQFNALVDRFREANRALDFRFGVLCATVAGMFGKKKDGSNFEPGDFFASCVLKKKKREMSADEIAHALELIFPKCS